MSDAACECDLCARRAGCFAVLDPDFDPPAGWVEIQRDDDPEDPAAHRFEDDLDAAAWVSPAARVFFPDSGVSVRAGSPSVSGDVARSERWRAIVPALDAIDAGVME